MEKIAVACYPSTQPMLPAFPISGSTLIDIVNPFDIKSINSSILPDVVLRARGVGKRLTL